MAKAMAMAKAKAMAMAKAMAIAKANFDKNMSKKTQNQKIHFFC